VKLKDLITPSTINPDYERYELHRVWVLEGNLKSGVRHIYAKRLLYADEDTWLTLTADNYDSRGQLWRVNLVNFFYSQESKTYHAARRSITTSRQARTSRPTWPTRRATTGGASTHRCRRRCSALMQPPEAATSRT